MTAVLTASYINYRDINEANVLLDVKGGATRSFVELVDRSHPGVFTVKMNAKGMM